MWRLALAFSGMLLIRSTGSHVAASVELQKMNYIEEFQSIADALEVSFEVLTSLTGKHCSNWDAIDEIYKVMDFEVYDNRKFFQMPRTRNESIALFEYATKRSLKGFQDVNLSCLEEDRERVHEYYASIPQELKEIKPYYHGIGSIMLHLTRKCPDKWILDGVGEISAELVRGVNSKRNEGSTSFGRYLTQGKEAYERLQILQQYCH